MNTMSRGWQKDFILSSNYAMRGRDRERQKGKEREERERKKNRTEREREREGSHFQGETLSFFNDVLFIATQTSLRTLPVQARRFNFRMV